MAEWYEKFKVGDKVRVIKKVIRWRFSNSGGCSWAPEMNKSIGKVYKITDIDRFVGYRLDTGKGLVLDFYYPVESLECPIRIGEQLLFDFMLEE